MSERISAAAGVQAVAVHKSEALMELIVINVGYDLGVISQQMFAMLVIMAVVSTIATTPGLRAWLPRVGLPAPVRQ
jgi:Kef-type K+ transport system membrane component KefB